MKPQWEVAIRRWVALIETWEASEISTCSFNSEQGQFSGESSDFGRCVLQQSASDNLEEMQQSGKAMWPFETEGFAISLQ